MSTPSPTRTLADFACEGLRFRYPQSWRLERDETPAGWSVTVQSPGTAFLLISCDRDCPTTDEVLNTTLAALRSDYEDLDVQEALDSLAGQPAFGATIAFFTLDLTNTCWLRCFSAAAGTVLVLWQVTDLELEKYEPTLQAICASLTCDEDE